MARLISIFALLLLVVPFIYAGGHKTQSSSCKLSVSSSLTDSSNRQYTGTITNVGSGAAANVLLSPSGNVRTVDGLTANDIDGYTLTSDAVSAGGIDVGSTYTFTYTTASRNSNIRWSASCTDAASSNAPSSAPKAATTAPKAATTAPKAPTAAPKAATDAPTTAAKAAATAAPTTAGKAATTAPSTGGRICPTGTWWAPAPQTTWQWQLNGNIDQSFNVQMYDIDLFDNTAATISALHAKGRAVICYFSTQYENWRPDASSFTSAVRGNALDGWAGENYVDIRSTVVRNIMTARLDKAVSMGCDGVEPDNVDGYQASSGFPLTAADQISFNSFLAAQAHARGLSIGLKNDLDQSAALQPYFDWALNEQCNQYGECSSLNNFISAGKAVFNCEYSGSSSSVCPKMVTSKFSSIFKGLDLNAPISAQCCTYQSGGCAAATHRCISSM